MKTPDCVIWGLTKKNNAFLKKFNGNQWSHSPLSVSGFHNASNSASTCSVQGVKKVQEDKAAKKDDEKKNEKSKKVFEIVMKHRMHHGRKVIKKNSTSQPDISRNTITKDVHRVAKVINGLTFQSDAHKKQLLKRLAKASHSLRSSV